MWDVKLISISISSGGKDDAFSGDLGTFPIVNGEKGGGLWSIQFQTSLLTLL